MIPSSTYRLSVRSQVPVAALLTSPLLGSTAYNGALPPRLSQISLSVTQPPRVMPSADSRYSRAEDEAYRMSTGVVGSHSGLGMAVFGDSVSMAPAGLAAATRRPIMSAAVRTIFGVVVTWTCTKQLLSKTFQPRCCTTGRVNGSSAGRGWAGE